MAEVRNDLLNDQEGRAGGEEGRGGGEDERREEGGREEGSVDAKSGVNEGQEGEGEKEEEKEKGRIEARNEKEERVTSGTAGEGTGETAEGKVGSVMNGMFKSGWSLYDLQLNTTHLCWDNVNRKAKHIFSYTVAISDILAVTSDEQKSPGQPVTGFTIHYVTRHKNHLWKVTSSRFQAEEEGMRQKWVEQLQNRIQQAARESQRPTSLLVFLNPVSGGGKSEKIYKQNVAPIFELAGIKTTVVATTHKQHVTEYLQECNLDGIDGLIVVGGDGSVCELVTGALKRFMKEAGRDFNDPEVEIEPCPIRIGTIPTGTGRLLAFWNTGNKDPITSVLHIILGNSTPMEVISVFNDGKLVAHSTVVIGYGYFGEVTRDAENMRMFGEMRFIASVIKGTWSTMKHYDFDVHYLPPEQQVAEHEQELEESSRTFSGIKSDTICTSTSK